MKGGKEDRKAGRLPLCVFSFPLPFLPSFSPTFVPSYLPASAWRISRSDVASPRYWSIAQCAR